MVDSARKPISLSARSSPVSTVQATRTIDLQRARQLPSEWPAIQFPSRARSKGVTNTVYTNNNHRNLHSRSKSGFASSPLFFQWFELFSYASSPKRIHGAGEMLS